MRVLTSLIIGSLFLVILSGCPIWIEEGENICREDENCYCDEWGCYTRACIEHEDCAIGYYCDHESRSCERSKTCDYSEECDYGFYCDWRHTCVPDPNVGKSCETNEDCGLSGYCHPTTKECVGTGRCRTDEDCKEYGEGLICDDRGVCVLDLGPCPDGHCGCSNDSECQNGMLCINNLCRYLDEVCIFDFQCGDNETCINNECHRYCTVDEDCPTGEECKDGICLKDEDGKGECIYNQDCGVDMFCVNSTCHKGCEKDSDCAQGEYCLSGICRADTRPKKECREDTDCSGDRICVDGFCRMPCAVNSNCSTEGEFNVCGSEGYCIRADEENPECIRKEDCDSKLCIDGHCG